MDTTGNLWVGTWGDGLFKVNTKNHFAQHIPINAFRGIRLPVNEILAIETDSLGNLWLGTFGFGVLYYDLRDQSIKQFLEGRKRMAMSRR